MLTFSQSIYKVTVGPLKVPTSTLFIPDEMNA